MECNKDDAIKAAELAEKKYSSRDLAGARRFCNKALQLYPGLEQARSLLAVVDVHCAAEVKLDGVEDYYGVLQVDPQLDFAGIKKQYRKLALVLHPDKNKVAGADSAFKILSEAWNVLQDKERRASYDEKRSSCLRKQQPNGSYSTQNAPEQPSASSFPGMQAQQQRAHAQAQAHPMNTNANANASGSGSAPATNGQPTFWTQCPGCKIQYQYYRKFENYQLLCHRCKTGFIAADIGVPPTGPAMPVKKKGPNGESVNGVQEAFNVMQQKAREREEKKREEERKKAEREREKEEKRRLKEALRRAKEEDRRKEILEKQMLKQREKEEKEARKKNMEALKKKLKRKAADDEEEDDDEDEDLEEMSDDEEEFGSENNSNNNAGGINLASIPLEILRFGLRRSNRHRRNVVYKDDYDEDDELGSAAKRARTDDPAEAAQTRKELAEHGRSLVLRFLRAFGMSSTEADHPADHPQEQEQEQEPEPEPEPEPASEPDASDAASGGGGDEEAHYLVPDPDFHNFDRDRKEEAVNEGQVWALYDDNEGMPRFYCEVKSVVSVRPFKVRIRWLERYEGLENAGEWERAGFVVACGGFKCKRKTETEEHFNKFSHLMEVGRPQGNVFNVFPAKGEVWAVYRDWSLGWLYSRPPDAGLRYEMVEVVSKYFDETGVSVLPLVKVGGYKTIFARSEEAQKVFYRGELLRFSHKVPAHWMTGKEKENAPRDCWELDTAATPTHLIFER